MRLLSTTSDKSTFTEKRFRRVKTGADNADAMGLSPQQKRLAERRRDAFIRSGANLDAAGKAGAVQQEARAAFEALVMLTGHLRDRKLDPVKLMAEVTP